MRLSQLADTVCHISFDMKNEIFLEKHPLESGFR
jgi:hypothetical protein